MTSRTSLSCAAATVVGIALLTAAPVDAASLRSAYRTIASKTFVDLTHSFGPDSPVWSGFGQAKMTM